ncbi:hypothetical protein M9X92_008900 [Pyricularia oryzae]|nr:hypothetical protein M9X92_008900 [Pyricularia oryzae]
MAAGPAARPGEVRSVQPTLMSEVGTSLLNSGPNFTVMLLEEPKYTYGRPLLAVVQLGTSNVLFAYTCVRKNGMRIDELRALINLFLQT